AGEQVGCPSVTELVLHEPLVIPEHDTVLIQVVVSDEPADGRGVRIYSRRQSPEPLDTRPVWTKHAEAVLRSDPARGSDSPTASPAASPTVHPMISPTTYPTAELTTNLTTDPAVWPPLDAVPVDVSDCYGRLARRGYQYGPAFRGLRAAWRRGAELYAEVALPEAAGGDDFGLHPALLDAALHALEYLDPGREATAEQVRLPFAWAGLRLHAVGATIARVRIVAIGPDAYELTLTDPDGQLVCTVESLTLRPIARDRLLAANT